MIINKKYNYVSLEKIKVSITNFSTGTLIRSIDDLKKWINNTFECQRLASNLAVATFVIDLNENLRLAERRSEHFAYAGGELVLSAGEIFITWDKTGFDICEITNQSTGYCPEIDSWNHVETALKKIPINCPAHFTVAFTFRRCPYCSQINIVKNDVFICSVCNSNLPNEWNFK